MNPADSGQNPDPGRLRGCRDGQHLRKDGDLIQVTGVVVWIGLGVEQQLSRGEFFQGLGKAGSRNQFFHGPLGTSCSSAKRHSTIAPLRSWRKSRTAGLISMPADWLRFARGVSLPKTYCQ